MLKKLLKDLPPEIIQECAKVAQNQPNTEEYYDSLVEDYKIFARWNIKFEMLRRAKEYLEQNNVSVSILLDLASGRGNELAKWIQLKIPRVIGLELDPEQIKIAINRYKPKRKIINVSYVQGSATDYQAVRKAVKTPFKGTISKKVPIITNNFALNYFFESKASLESFLRGVSDSLEDGGMFLGTAADGDTIKMILKLMGSNKIKTQLYYINKLTKGYSDFGEKYQFQIKTPYFKKGESEEERIIEEYLVQKDVFVDYAKKFDLIPYSLTPRVPAVFNFLQQPLTRWKKRGLPPKNWPYYKRPIEIASLFFGFSFIKADTELLENIENPKCLIVVPYRDDDKGLRKKHLEKFLKKFKTYFTNMPKIPKIDILVCNQDNDKKFNRGLLLNTGIKTLGHNYNFFILHDVDLIPNKKLLDYYYTYPVNPIHLGYRGQRYSPKEKTIFDTLYMDKRPEDGGLSTFLGGVLSISKKDYEQINGFPNNFWGWGGEDDALRKRLSINKIAYVNPPVGSVKDLEEKDGIKNWQEKKDVLYKTGQMASKDVRNRLKKEDISTWKKNGLEQTKSQKLIKKDEYKNIYWIDVK